MLHTHSVGLRGLASVLLALFPALLAGSLARPAGAEPAGPETMPEFASDGRLKFPQGYREWIYLTSGLDMSYREHPEAQGHSMFDNVFVNPAAYRHFLASGNWPEGTLLVMENRMASGKGSINRSGKFQSGEPMGVEVHVKDSRRFPGGWAFFAFGATEPAIQIPTAAECYTCHRDHAAVDTTFVQFYPTLLGAARKHGTVKAGE